MRNNRLRFRPWIVLLFVTATLLGTAIPALAAGTLSMTAFTPASGPVGRVVTITGTGFVNGDIVWFNGTQASGSTANRAGTTLKASVPAFATSGMIAVTDPLTGQTVGLPNSPFTVATGVFASPNHAWAGGRLTLSGSGLTPLQTELIHIGRLSVGAARIDASGNFQTSVSVPWNLPSGKSSISVVDPRYLRIATILLISGDWPAFRQDASHAGYDNYETVLSTSSVSGLKQKWTFSEWTGAAVIAGGLVYSVASGVLSAFDAITGKRVWVGEYTFWPFSPVPSLTESNGLVFGSGQNCGFGCDYPTVQAFDATSGLRVWKTYVGNFVETPAAVANGIVYVGSDDGNVYALRATTGAVVWTYNTGSPVHSAPAVAGGVVYVGSDNGRIYALKASTGALLWSDLTGAAVQSSPAVANGLVFVGSNDGSFYAFNAASGAAAWSLYSGYVSSSPAIAGATVYVSAGPAVYALDAATGTVIWLATPSGAPSSPALANGVVYVGSTDTNIYALNAVTGAPLWSKNLGVSAGSPAVANGMIYVPVLVLSVAAGLTAFGL